MSGRKSRHRSWCFTWNNPDIDSANRIVAWTGREWFRYVAFQRETGDSGTLHLQGYLEVRHPYSVVSLLDRLGTTHVHVEPRRGSQYQAIDYCRKPGGHGFTEYGEPSNQGARADLEDVKHLIDHGADEIEIWTSHFASACRYHRSFTTYRNVRAVHSRYAGGIFKKKRIFWHTGPSGSGKTSKAIYDAARTHGAQSLYIKSPSNGQNAWFDGISSQHRVLILDEFRSDIQYSLLLRILDGYPVSVETKHGSVSICLIEDIYITSNYAPGDVYPNITEIAQREPLYRRLDHILLFKKWTQVCETPQDITTNFRI